MNNLTICIGRQLGSGGRIVAKLIAERMGMAFYDKEIITEAARESGLDRKFFEKVDEKPSAGSIGSLSSYAMPYYAGCYMNTASYLSNDNLFSIQSSVIMALAHKGPSVFVGRCADYILRDEPDMLSVFITANTEDRIRRVCGYFSIDERAAAEMIRDVDRKRAEYYNYYTFKRWGDAASYDLCLSTSVIGVEDTAEKIIGVCREKFGQE